MSAANVIPNALPTIFVSSTMGRKASGSESKPDDRRLTPKQILRLRIIDALLRNWYFPVTMEYFSGPTPVGHPADVIAHVRASDAFVAVLDDDFGTEIEPNKSYLMLEYDTARMADIPRFLFVDQEFRRVPAAALSAGQAAQRRFIDAITLNDPAGIHDYRSTEGILNSLIPALKRAEIRRKARFVQVAAGSAEHASIDAKYRGLLREALSVLMASMESFVVIRLNTDMKGDVGRTIMNFRQDMERLLERMATNSKGHPLIMELAEETIRKFTVAFEGLTSMDGYRPQNIDDLRRVAERLYAQGRLAQLDATAIISSKEGLAAFKNYWTHREIGEAFARLNETFIKAAPRRVRRAFLCDSLIDALEDRNSWFYLTALKQASLGADIKVGEIDDIAERDLIQDYGIYTHEIEGKHAGTYALLAPQDLNDVRDLLQTRIVADEPQVSAMQQRFEKLWSGAMLHEPIKIVDPTPVRDNCAAFGTIRVGEFLQNNAIFRNMVLLRNGSKMNLTPDLQMRKHQPEYADQFKKYIEREYGFTRNGYRGIVYIGDSNHTDGAFIRNLQREGVSMLGFVHDEWIGTKDVIVNDVLYASRWSSLQTFLGLVRRRFSELSRLMVVFEIDETLWAPRGLLQECLSLRGQPDPLEEARAKAVGRIVIEEYFGGDVFMRTHIEKNQSTIRVDSINTVLPYIYRVVGGREYSKLIKDNEDNRAMVTIILAFGLVSEATGDFQSLFSTTTVDDFKEADIQRWSKRIVAGFSSMRDLVMKAYYGLEKNKLHYMKVGMNPHNLANDLLEYNMDQPVAFPRFRNYELRETVAAVRAAASGGDQVVLGKIVVNKSLVDFLNYMRERTGSDILGLSDRPDEATYDVGTGISLLGEEMMVYGQPLELPS